MLTKTITLLVLLLSRAILASILKSEVNLERNNILNKGIWVRNKLTENLFDKTRTGNFVFRENSLDVDNLLQNAFDPFNGNYRDDAVTDTDFMNRPKRAIRRIRAQRQGKNGKNCIGKKCKTLELEKEEKSKGAVKRDDTDDTNTSLANEYPYEVAMLLKNNKRKTITLNNSTHTFENEIQGQNLSILNDRVKNSRETDFKENITDIHKTPTNTPRSKKYLESEVIKKFEITEDMNRTQDNNEENGSRVIDRNIFDKDNTVWHQNAPIPNVNIYKVVPKEPQKSKAVNERGLIKVISMLTKTFKKIMKQHNEVKHIHERISDVNEEFIKNSVVINNKFKDFDEKYVYLLKLHDKLKKIELKLARDQEYFQNKEKEMTNSFKEFETQQKKFLQQQRQFYNIQKLMLAQNEKVNLKQNAIAKTQSEISHRQNNFARILKKAKQLYLEARNPISKLSSNLIKTIQHPTTVTQNSYISTTTPSTESVKINLFSIPTSNKIENQDDMIIKEKDDQTIDDLVYKYYFNNTFIDNIMKNNVLSSLMSVSSHPGVARNVKNKRNELETTILLPIFENNNSDAIETKNRERRWINHHSRHRGKRRERGKGGVATIINATDAKAIRNKVVNNIRVDADTLKSKDEGDVKVKYDPFLAMATNFCNEIRQNKTAQLLQWCVEKSLRRLRFLDKDHLTHDSEKTEDPPTLDVSDTTGAQWIPNKVKEYTGMKSLSIEMDNYSTSEPSSKPSVERNIEPTRNTFKAESVTSTTSTDSTVTTVTGVTDTPTTQPQLPSTQRNTTLASVTTLSESPSSVTNAVVFFPDNERLESNLQQFDMKPDTEGNVYYEGSVHASDVILDSDSQGIDDIMPGIESNSRIEMDPMTFDLQSQRRAIVRKLNEKIKMSLG